MCAMEICLNFSSLNTKAFCAQLKYQRTHWKAAFNTRAHYHTKTLPLVTRCCVFFVFSLNSFLPWFCYCVIQKIHFAAFYKLIYAKLFIFFCIFSFCCCAIATATDAEYYFFRHTLGLLLQFFFVCCSLFVLFTHSESGDVARAKETERGKKKRTEAKSF